MHYKIRKSQYFIMLFKKKRKADIILDIFEKKYAVNVELLLLQYINLLKRNIFLFNNLRHLGKKL